MNKRLQLFYGPRGQRLRVEGEEVRGKNGKVLITESEWRQSIFMFPIWRLENGGI